MKMEKNRAFTAKKSVLFAAACGLVMWALTACEPKEEPIPASFPKKHLIEEFTGQDCGYCPYGMDCVHDFIGNDTNWIVVLHHYGYQADHFSVSGSQKITKQLGVTGAPNVTIDRTIAETEDGNAKCFHPGYLPTIDRTQLEKTTYASVNVENSYNESLGVVKIHVSGAICKADAPKLKLTVLVKESGMVDYQEDYYGSYEGWKEFRHANAVREYATEPMGDELTVDENRKYSVYFNVYLDDKWVAENCAVVAFLSEDFDPVVQAGWAPVVPGTKGGQNILHGGITPVPVASYYPEPGADISPSTYSGREADTLNVAQGRYASYTEDGINLWEVRAYNSSAVVNVGKTPSVPYAFLYVVTDINTTSIPTGTYQIDTTMAAGTVYAGYRDDSRMEIDGTMLYYLSKSYYDQGYLMPSAQWLIVDGTLEVTASGWALNGHARNGTDVRLVGSKPITNKGKMAKRFNGGMFNGDATWSLNGEGQKGRPLPIRE